MAKVLILFAHPRLETSRSNLALIREIPKHKDLTFRDLYQLYPDFNIDVEKEKRLLLENNIIIWHHPLYWYSSPPLVKQWIDVVLEFGWAYGPGGTALKGKTAFNVITSGGAREAYSPNGHHSYTLREFLRPFERTTTLCHMTYLPPFAVQGTHRLSDAGLFQYAKDYAQILTRLLEGDYSLDDWKEREQLNDTITTINQSPIN